MSFRISSEILFSSNWELCGARAASVLRYLQANGIHPLVDNSTAQGRARNHRAELILEHRRLGSFFSATEQ